MKEKMMNAICAFVCVTASYAICYGVGYLFGKAIGSLALNANDSEND